MDKNHRAHGDDFSELFAGDASNADIIEIVGVDDLTDEELESRISKKCSGSQCTTTGC